MDVASLADLLHETAAQHGAFEAVGPPHDRWDWNAAYMTARQSGQNPEQASAAARPIHGGRQECCTPMTSNVSTPSPIRSIDGFVAAGDCLGATRSCAHPPTSLRPRLNGGVSAYLAISRAGSAASSAAGVPVIPRWPPRGSLTASVSMAAEN
jgi:hypothetical protein